MTFLLLCLGRLCHVRSSHVYPWIVRIPQLAETERTPVSNFSDGRTEYLPGAAYLQSTVFFLIKKTSSCSPHPRPALLPFTIVQLFAIHTVGLHWAALIRIRGSSQQIRPRRHAQPADASLVFSTYMGPRVFNARF
ncbi:hypothetical protein LY76DRAFT_303122 [Colletotrichum caudatum]|nr:hypothetical protein LY76DRAFT_303122 [Colletotrichum caudatum]